MQSVASSFRNYRQFSGRSHRTEYLWFLAFCVVATSIASAVDRMAGFRPQPLFRGDVMLFGHAFPAHAEILAPVSAIIGLVLFLPMLAVQVRRLHDADRPAWWLRWLLLPLLGGLVILSCSLLPGTDGANRYGDDPRA